MAWIINNWSFLVVILVVVILGALFFHRFSKLSYQDKLAMVKQWLLWAVLAAEKEYANGTGILKLHATYDMFVQRFPDLVTLISFEMFSKFVDEALVQMRHILETNKDIAAYVEDKT